MKILYHHRTQGRGAEGVHIRGIVEAFRRLGHEVVVVSPPGIDPFRTTENGSNGAHSNGKPSRLGRLWRWLGKHLPEVLFEMLELGYNLVAYRNMARLVKNGQFDFMYERYALNTFAGLWISKKYRIPLILEVNDASCIERVRKLKVRAVAKFVEGIIFKGAHSIVTISSYFKKIIIDEGIDPAKVYVLSNAVDGTTFDTMSKPRAPLKEKYAFAGKTVIGYVGAFVRWHGVDLLLESFRDLFRKNKDLRLLLVGDGVTFGMTKDFARAHGLDSCIIMPGRVEHDEVSSYIDDMDICVIPDSNEYGSPMKLFEYMARGKPVVAPRLLPMVDVIKNGENGILFEPKDKGELNKALGVLISDTRTRNKVGESAKNTIFENHTWTKNAEKVLEIVGNGAQD